MAGRRTPIGQALTAGAVEKNPARYADRLASLRARKPLGDPPASMTDAEREAWRDFRDSLPWLARPHRAIVHLACRLRCRIEGGELVGVNAISTYSALLSKLGATPVDDGRVSWPEDDEDEDPADGYFN